jgi:hypothetical protein
MESSASPKTTTPFWIYDIRILFESDFATKLVPVEGMTSPEKFNAITRFVLIATIIGYTVTRNANLLLTGLVTIVAIVVLNYIQNDRAAKEGFGATGMATGMATDLALASARAAADASATDATRFTQPTPENPAMNVMPADIYDTPDRLPAAQANNPAIAGAMSDAVKQLAVRGRRENNEDPDPKLDPRLFQDMEDEREFAHSMRSFQPTASTQIPNDQGKFADYLYGNMVSCKAGDDVACMRNNQRHTNM